MRKLLLLLLLLSIPLAYSQGRLRVRGRGADVQVPLAPTNLLPADSSTDVVISETLSWDSSSGASSYDVYLDTTDGSTYVTNTTATSYNPTLDYSTTYYIKVCAKNANGQGCTSVQSFTTESLGSKTVLSNSDFTYVGAFTANVDGMNAPYQLGLTIRYVSGDLRLYTMQSAGSNRNHLFEMSVPALNQSAPFNSATLTNDYGDITSGNMVIQTAGGGTTYIYGLYWDPVDERIYWAYQNNYCVAVGCPQNACLGYSTLDDTTHTGTGIKAVSLPSQYTSKIAFGITPIPASFQANVSGYRLALGFGGITSGGATASIGPALLALSPADITSTSNQQPLSNVIPIVQHSGLRDPYDGSNFYAIRDADYYPWHAGWVPGTGGQTGWWGQNDFLRQSGIWIETDSRTGFLVLGSMSSNSGYNTNQSTILVSADTTGAVLSSPIPGLAAGDYLDFDSTSLPQGGRAVRITSVSGNPAVSITYDDGRGNPINFTPDVPGTAHRGQFYRDGTTGSTQAKHTAFVYAPADLAKGVSGEYDLDQVPWANSWDIQFPFLSYPLGGYNGGEPPYLVTGAAFDTSTNLLYVMLKNNPPIIAVYSITH
jgi:hypothetical protein